MARVGVPAEGPWATSERSTHCAVAIAPVKRYADNCTAKSPGQPGSLHLPQRSRSVAVSTDVTRLVRIFVDRPRFHHASTHHWRRVIVVIDHTRLAIDHL